MIFEKGMHMRELKGFRNEYYFLSNFYNCPVLYNGKQYMSSEAAFQAQKSLDDAVQWSFTGLSARDARTKGKTVSLRPDWEEVKDEIMSEILESKFSNPDLKEKLLETGDAYLEETNTWHDNYWGNCICNKCKDIPGGNMLGKTLMNLREKIREQEMEYGK